MSRLTRVPDHFPTRIEDISRLFWDTFFEKLLHTDFSDKAESLAIFAFCIWESGIFRDLTDFTLHEVSDRKECS